MPNFEYTIGIPDAPNDPSEDQPDMKINNDSNASIWEVDHFGFNDNFGGIHKQVRMPVRGGPPGSIPPGMIVNEGALYTKVVTDLSLYTKTDLFYTPDTTGNQYQMTRTNSPYFPKFATNTSYGTIPAGFTQVGGWTFLPGGMLYQYGFFGKPNATGSSGTVEFPIPFTNAYYSVTLVLRRSSGDQSITIDRSVAASNATFKFLTSSAGSDGVYWTAIGV